jgi:hypothetical protein
LTGGRTADRSHINAALELARQEDAGVLPDQWQGRVRSRVSPDAGARECVRMRLAASVDNMRLIEDASGRVI